MKGHSIKAQRLKEHGMFRDTPLAPMQKPQNTHGEALGGTVGEVESWLSLWVNRVIEKPSQRRTRTRCPGFLLG